MKRRHQVALGLLAALAVAQVIPVDRTNPPVRSEVDAPPEVASLLRRACYDCHSYETRWPWYSHVAPVSWILAHHVEEGRKELNFSEWPTLDFETQQHDLKDISEQVSEGKMPILSYRLMHPEARLDAAERARILAWAKAGED